MSQRASSEKRPERRTSEDRRKRPTNPFGLLAYRGRRKTVRREEDRRRLPYTDQYSRRLLLSALLLILLCVADALYTIQHVSEGGFELNPLMDNLLQRGPFLFFAVKFILTALGVFLLVIYRHHPLGLLMFGGAVLVYGALFFYQIFLFYLRSMGGG
jgi:hypothetical protein